MGTTHKEAASSGQDLLKMIKSGGDVNEILKMIEAGADVNAKDLQGSSLLHIAAGKRAGDCAEPFVRALITAGADVNAKSDLGETPLHRAARFGNERFAVALIEGGADVNATDMQGYSPLFAAVSVHTDIKNLLNAGADVNAMRINGETPLHRICSNHMSVSFNKNEDADALSVERLLLAGARTNIIADYWNGLTVLDWARNRIGDKVATKIVEHDERMKLRDLLHAAVGDGGGDIGHAAQSDTTEARKPKRKM